MSTIQELSKQALELPVPQRAALAHELLLSLEQETDADSEAAWGEEIDARLERVEQGRYSATEWREALPRIRQSNSR
jgi:hypothetical protein